MYIYCNISVPKHDTMYRIKPASVNQALQKQKTDRQRWRGNYWTILVYVYM